MFNEIVKSITEISIKSIQMFFERRHGFSVEAFISPSIHHFKQNIPDLFGLKKQNGITQFNNKRNILS